MKQKRESKAYQAELFDKYGRPLIDNTVGSTEGVSIRADFLSALEEQRTSTKTLLDEILRHENVSKSMSQVRANKGSSGIDGKDINETEQWLGSHFTKLVNQILTNQYRVSPVRKVEIPKPEGGVRMLGIPTVLDLLWQTSIYLSAFIT